MSGKVGDFFFPQFFPIIRFEKMLPYGFTMLLAFTMFFVHVQAFCSTCGSLGRLHALPVRGHHSICPNPQPVLTHLDTLCRWFAGPTGFIGKRAGSCVQALQMHATGVFWMAAPPLASTYASGFKRSRRRQLQPKGASRCRLVHMPRLLWPYVFHD